MVAGNRRIAYVTGGMGGIGTAICRKLCENGHVVIAGCGPGSPRKDRWIADMRAAGAVRGHTCRHDFDGQS